MKVYLEYLYHFCCDRCQKWWTVADIKPEIGQMLTCPHCEQKNAVETIEASIINNRVGGKEIQLSEEIAADAKPALDLEEYARSLYGWHCLENNLPLDWDTLDIEQQKIWRRIVMLLIAEYRSDAIERDLIY